MRHFLILLTLLHGCLSVPSLDLAKTKESLGCDQAAERAVQSGEWAIGDWPDRDWWRKFDDPILSCLIEKALKSSPTLLMVEAQLKAAHQMAIQAGSKLLPEISFDAEDEWQHVSRYGILRGFIPQIYPAVLNETKFGLNFKYEFDFWGKNKALLQSAMGRARAQLAESLQAELILTTSIATTYAETQLLLKKRGLLQQLEANLKEIEAIRIKRKAIDDVFLRLQASSNSLNTTASLVQIDQEISVHINKLKALSGQNQDAELSIPYRPFNPIVLTLPENLSLDLISRRPDLIGQKARVEAAGLEIKAAVTDFYPNINLTAFFGLDSFFWDKLFNRKSYNGFIDPAIHLPIFTAGRLKAQLREKAELFNQAVHAYDELILAAAQEVADIITNIHRFHKEIEVREKSLQIVQKQSEITEKRLKNALDNRISDLSAKNAKLELELTFTEVEYGKLLSSIELIRALGGGFHE
jgi:NodT family efflux transporter outer membrane factor (OMF) lipoprotein